nr:Chain B, Integrin beta-5 [Homo sapiens]7S48_B Chain B, Integrin beta-5 [Homo sapiens]
ERSRARYEMAS